MTGSFADIHEAAARLRAGRVVAFPTETVYGLGADALSEQAVARVYQLKGRPERNPLIVHVSGPEMARRVVGAWPDEADAIARAFWPGPVSMILPKAPPIPGIVTAGGPTVAVRCPMHPVALALLFEFAGPLVGPSANLSGRVSPTAAAHVREAFSADDVLVLEGGRCTGGIESTVVDLTRPDAPRILRPGLIGPDDLARACGRPVEYATPAAPRDEAPLASPGLLDRHYAPGTPARLFAQHEWPGILAKAAGPAVVLTHRMRHVEPPHRMIVMPAEAQDYAAALYAGLREADALGVSAILIERPPTDGDDAPVWRAIADRLARATSPA